MKTVNEKPKIKIKRKEAKGYYRQKNRRKYLERLGSKKKNQQTKKAKNMVKILKRKIR